MMTAEEVLMLAAKREPREKVELDPDEIYEIIEERYLEAKRNGEPTDTIRLSPSYRQAMRYKVENVCGRIFTKKEVDRFFEENCYVFEIFDEYENEVRDEKGERLNGIYKIECVLLVDVALCFGLENTLDALHASMLETEADELKRIFTDGKGENPLMLGRADYDELMAKMVLISTREILE